MQTYGTIDREKPPGGLIPSESDDLVAKVGAASSLASAGALALFLLLYAINGPWKDMPSYAVQARGWLTISIFVLIFLLTIFFVIAVATIHVITPERWKLLSLIALGFALMYAAICSANCFLQLSFVQQRIAAGADLGALEPWTSASPNSALFATDNLAFFLQGLATVALVPLFGGSRMMNTIKWLFVSNGVFNAIGLVVISALSMETSSGRILYFFMVLGWATVLGASLALLSVVFHRRLLPGFRLPKEIWR